MTAVSPSRSPTDGSWISSRHRPTTSVAGASNVVGSVGRHRGVAVAELARQLGGDDVELRGRVADAIDEAEAGRGRVERGDHGSRGIAHRDRDADQIRFELLVDD